MLSARIARDRLEAGLEMARKAAAHDRRPEDPARVCPDCGDFADPVRGRIAAMFDAVPNFPRTAQAGILPALAVISVGDRGFNSWVPKAVSDLLQMYDLNVAKIWQCVWLAAQAVPGNEYGEAVGALSDMLGWAQGESRRNLVLCLDVFAFAHANSPEKIGQMHRDGTLAESLHSHATSDIPVVLGVPRCG